MNYEASNDDGPYLPGMDPRQPEVTKPNVDMKPAEPPKIVEVLNPQPESSGESEIKCAFCEIHGQMGCPHHGAEWKFNKQNRRKRSHKKINNG